MKKKLIIMTVDKIKIYMRENNISQDDMADLMTKRTGRHYSQAMISKHLSHDSKLNMEEHNIMIEILNTHSE